MNDITNNNKEKNFTATVRDVSALGLGVIDAPNGQVAFVRGVWPGDRGVFRLIKIKKKYSFASLITLLEKSPDRIPAACPHQGFEPGQCGGCPWMMASYPSQLQHKQKLIINHLYRSKLLTDKTHVAEIIPSDSPLGYRNRGQVKTDGKKIGFVSSQSKCFAAINDCLILNQKARELLKEIISLLPQPQWSPRSEFLWSFIEFDDSLSLNDIKLNQRIPFRQANETQNEIMKNICRQWTHSLQKSEPLVELFCGSGNFTSVFIDEGFKQIFAAESDPVAVRKLKIKTKTTSHLTAQSFDIFHSKNWSAIKQWHSQPRYLFLDPPRGGFPQIDHFCDVFPTFETILYVSCDLHAFLQDAKKLEKKGFLLSVVQPIDQFPQTPHLELLAHFTRSYFIS